MALEHAILVSLSEQAASGAELTRRFDASIGHFWSATHQQIYRVLGRMEADGWVERAGSRTYVVTEAGAAELRRWIAEPTAPAPVRSDLGVKLRGASYGGRGVVLDDVRRLLEEHTKRHALFEFLAARDYPDPTALDGADLDVFLVLRGGILMEEFWIRWLEEYLTAHTRTTPPTSQESR